MRAASHVARNLVVSASFVLFAGCATLTQWGPQDNLVGGWDPNKWTECRDWQYLGVRMFTCVPTGERHDNWTQQFRRQTQRRGSLPPASEMAAQSIELMSKACSTFVQNVISEQSEPQGDVEQSILLEEEQRECPDYPDGYSISRILYGRFTVFEIAYIAKTREIARERRDEWLKQLSEATISKP